MTGGYELLEFDISLLAHELSKGKGRHIGEKLDMKE